MPPVTHRESPAVDHEIVVVDNASTDGTAAAIRARWNAVRVVDAGANLGFARANNLGIQQTFGELILLLNPDTSIPAHAVDMLLGALDARPDVAIAGPRLVNADGRAELSFGRMMSPLAEVRQKVLVRGSEARWADRDVCRVDDATGARAWTGSAAPACSCAGPTRSRSG